MLVALRRGEPIPYEDVVSAGRVAADTLLRDGTNVLAFLEEPGAGAWHLDRLTDLEAAALAVRLSVELVQLMATSAVE